MGNIKIINRNEIILQTNPAISLLQLLGRNGIRIPTKCGGRARCGYCKFTIHEGLESMSPLTIFEQKFRETNPLPDNVRLACQTYIAGDCTISLGQIQKP